MIDLTQDRRHIYVRVSADVIFKAGVIFPKNRHSCKVHHFSNIEDADLWLIDFLKQYEDSGYSIKQTQGETHWVLRRPAKS